MQINVFVYEMYTNISPIVTLSVLQVGADCQTGLKKSRVLYATFYMVIKWKYSKIGQVLNDIFLVGQ